MPCAAAAMHALACPSRANPRERGGRATSIGGRKPAVGVEGREGAVRRRLLPRKGSAAPRSAWLAINVDRAPPAASFAMLAARRACREAREAMRRARNSRCLLRRSTRSTVSRPCAPMPTGTVQRGRRSYRSIRTTRRPDIRGAIAAPVVPTS